MTGGSSAPAFNRKRKGARGVRTRVSARIWMVPYRCGAFAFVYRSATQRCLGGTSAAFKFLTKLNPTRTAAGNGGAIHGGDHVLAARCKRGRAWLVQGPVGVRGVQRTARHRARSSAMAVSCRGSEDSELAPPNQDAKRRDLDGKRKRGSR